MQHVTAEGTALVKQAEDAASNKKVCIMIFFLVRWQGPLIVMMDTLLQFICYLLQPKENQIKNAMNQVVVHDCKSLKFI